jgi:plasmid replication initiation protein
MTPREFKKMKLKKIENRKLNPYQKISNTFIESTVNKNAIGAFKIIFYLATILEKKDINLGNKLCKVKIDLREALKYTGLTTKDIRNNLKVMQETSISFINEQEEEELMINLLPVIKFQWGKKSIDIEIFSKIARLIVDVKNNYTFINTKELMQLKNKHSLRLLPALNLMANYGENIPKRRHYELEDLNDLFGTKYKRLIDIERYILKPVKKELDNAAKLSFMYEVNFDNFGKGRPKAVNITIDIVVKSKYQPKLFKP